MPQAVSGQLHRPVLVCMPALLRCVAYVRALQEVPPNAARWSLLAKAVLRVLTLTICHCDVCW